MTKLGFDVEKKETQCLGGTQSRILGQAGKRGEGGES